MMPAEPPSLESRAVLRRLAAYLGPQRFRLIVGLACAALAGTVPAGVAESIKRFANTAATGDTSQALAVSVGVIGLYTALLGLRYGQGLLLAEVTQRVGMALRRDVYAHLQRMSLAFFSRQRTGALLSTLTNDVGRLQNAAMLLKDGVALPITAVVMLVLLFRISWQLSLFTLLVVPLMAGVIGRITRRMRVLSAQTQARQADVNAVMDETLSAMRVVKAFGAEEREVARFEIASQAAFAATMRGVRRTALLAPVVDWIGALSIALILYFGAREMALRANDLNKGLSLAEFLQFVFVANTLAQSVSGIGSLRGAWQELLGSADRIFGEVLGIAPQIDDAPGAVALSSAKGRIAFENVTFRYDDGPPVLSEIDLVIEPGEIVALVGPTGAGKTTLADLVPRFYDPTAGRVTIDGQDLRSVTLKSLRDQIALVPQSTLLFSGTIRDNIAYGRPDALDDEIVAAACAANADAFIREKPEGYATRVGERGATLSGGQQQRIAIARALLANPRILILDEATSALDAQTEALVQEALDRLMLGRTTIVIAHRLSTIVRANKIVVLDQGRIMECGTHSQLLARGGLYAALTAMQQRPPVPEASDGGE
jgi:subfamily B ATP-binding cassette protein MsbA